MLIAKAMKAEATIHAIQASEAASEVTKRRRIGTSGCGTWNPRKRAVIGGTQPGDLGSPGM
jgi:hypothetical protein